MLGSGVLGGVGGGGGGGGGFPCSCSEDGRARAGFDRPEAAGVGGGRACLLSVSGRCPGESGVGGLLGTLDRDPSGARTRQGARDRLGRGLAEGAGDPPPPVPDRGTDGGTAGPSRHRREPGPDASEFLKLVIDFLARRSS